MKWENVYRQKRVSLDQAITDLPGSGAVIVSMAAMEPQGVLSQIHKYADHFSHLRIITCLNMKKHEFCSNTQYKGRFVNECWFYSSANRHSASLASGLVDFIPCNLHQAGKNRIQALKDEGIPITYWGAAAPMQNKTGFLSMGVSNGYELEALEAADTVILEVNDQVPWTHGETLVHIQKVDNVVECNYELPVIPNPEPSHAEIQMAEHIVDMVPHGATLQIGIGALPNAVASLLINKKDLGIHTEMFTENMIDLFEKGVITNSLKSIHRYKTVCSFALGSRRMYDWLDNNPGIQVMKASYVNKPEVLGQNTLMTSINSAISVDLTGQVSSESFGNSQYSGTGGQLDTHRGAQLSEGGKGIIALKSTAKNGTISTIVPHLSPGTSITVPRQDLDWVVTEYGAVQLRGRTVAERAKKLISIAHPQFRDKLEKEARTTGLLH